MNERVFPLHRCAGVKAGIVIWHWFLSLDDARKKIEAWRVDHNEYRPHQSLSDRIPQELIIELQQAGNL